MSFDSALRRSTPTEEEVCAAVRNLRQAYDETQQQFADRVDATVRTITRYENDGPPRGVQLVRLWSLARKKNLGEIADTLRRWYARCLWEEMKDTGFKQHLSDYLEAVFVEAIKEKALEQLRPMLKTMIETRQIVPDLKDDEHEFIVHALFAYREAGPQDRMLLGDFDKLLWRARLMREFEERIRAEEPQDRADRAPKS